MERNRVENSRGLEKAGLSIELGDEGTDMEKSMAPNCSPGSQRKLS